jgi:hypothetical protein
MMGEQLFQRIYTVLKLAKNQRLESQDVQAILKPIIGKESALKNYCFTLEQIVALEAD